MNITQDKNNNTTVEWELEGVTARMIDWFWANMEKGFFLWHPSEHHEFYWAERPVADKVLGTIHVAPQTWNDGQRMEPHIKFLNPAELGPEITDYIEYEHVMVVGAVCLKKEDFKPGLPVIGYRIHQWERSDRGIRGKSTCVGETLEKGLVWAAHAGEEVGNWEVFLPQLYSLYRVIDNPTVCPFFPLNVERVGDKVVYSALK